MNYPNSRHALIMLDIDLAPETMALLRDHNLDILKSFDSPPNKIVLLIRGNNLPEECRLSRPPLNVVNLVVSTESYGSQKIRRITDIFVNQAQTVLLTGVPRQ